MGTSLNPKFIPYTYMDPGELCWRTGAHAFARSGCRLVRPAHLLHVGGSLPGPAERVYRLSRLKGFCRVSGCMILGWG